MALSEDFSQCRKSVEAVLKCSRTSLRIKEWASIDVRAVQQLLCVLKNGTIRYTLWYRCQYENECVIHSGSDLCSEFTVEMSAKPSMLDSRSDELQQQNIMESAML